MYAFGYVISPRKYEGQSGPINPHLVDLNSDDFDFASRGPVFNDPGGPIHVITGAGLEIYGTIDAPVVRQVDDYGDQEDQLRLTRNVASMVVSEAKKLEVAARESNASDAVSSVTTYLFDVDDALSETDDWDEVAAEMQAKIRDGEPLTKSAVDTFMQHIAIEKSVRPRSSNRPDSVGLSEERRYIPRRIMGMRDIDMLQSARAQHLVPSLAGPMGSGKTSLAEAAFGDELITANCFGTMTAADLVGQWQPVPNKPGDFVWVDGPLVTAMTQGRPLLDDDATFMPEEVQVLLLPVTDHRRSLTVTDRPDESRIVAAEGFCLILASNPGTGFGFTSPLKDRISVTITVPIDLQIARDMGCDPQLLSIARKLQQRQLDDPNATLEHWVPSLRTLLDCTQLGRAFGIQIAAVSMRAECPSDDPDLQEALDALFRSEFGEKLPKALIAMV